MVQIIQLKLINPKLKIGIVSWKQVYIYSPVIIQLKPEVERGRLVYRAKGSNKRISYGELKKGLIKKNCTLKMEVPNWYK